MRTYCSDVFCSFFCFLFPFRACTCMVTGEWVPQCHCTNCFIHFFSVALIFCACAELNVGQMTFRKSAASITVTRTISMPEEAKRFHVRRVRREKKKVVAAGETAFCFHIQNLELPRKFWFLCVRAENVTRN